MHQARTNRRERSRVTRATALHCQRPAGMHNAALLTPLRPLLLPPHIHTRSDPAQWLQVYTLDFVVRLRGTSPSAAGFAELPERRRDYRRALYQALQGECIQRLKLILQLQRVCVSLLVWSAKNRRRKLNHAPSRSTANAADEPTGGAAGGGGGCPHIANIGSTRSGSGQQDVVVGTRLVWLAPYIGLFAQQRLDLANNTLTWITSGNLM